MGRTPKVSIWRPKFLEALAETANVSEAAQYAGVDRSTAYRHKERYEQFASDWEDALEQACDSLEREAWRRAVEGVDHPVMYQGIITDTYKDYSDTLLIFLLKAHRPEKFRERTALDVTSGGQPVQFTTVEVVKDYGADDAS